MGELVAITPTGAALDALTADEVTVVDLAGEHVDGALAATSELDLHLGVYERFAAGGVVHTHAPMATALSLRARRAALPALPAAAAGRPRARRALPHLRHAGAGRGQRSTRSRAAPPR